MVKYFVYQDYNFCRFPFQGSYYSVVLFLALTVLYMKSVKSLPTDTVKFWIISRIPFSVTLLYFLSFTVILNWEDLTHLEDVL